MISEIKHKKYDFKDLVFCKLRWSTIKFNFCFAHLRGVNVYMH